METLHLRVQKRTACILLSHNGWGQASGMLCFLRKYLYLAAPLHHPPQSQKPRRSYLWALCSWGFGHFSLAFHLGAADE